MLAGLFFYFDGRDFLPEKLNLTPLGETPEKIIENKKISSFIYQLQNIDYKTLYSNNFDLAVIDWEEAGLSQSQLSDLQKQGKKIVSYLSIGEAENYRDYWQNWDTNPPPFLEKENPDWKGNYKIKFWEPAWQKIILDKIDKIVAAGYDGVYLDIIDAYYYFEEQGRSTAREEMIDFVAKISEEAKTENPNFLIIPQNSPELVGSEKYLSAIDGLGKEDTWYNDDEAKDEKEIESDLAYLKKVVQAGKFVLAIDYPTTRNKQCDFINKALSNGFVPFVSSRELDKIEVISCN